MQTYAKHFLQSSSPGSIMNLIIIKQVFSLTRLSFIILIITSWVQLFYFVQAVYWKTYQAKNDWLKNKLIRVRRLEHFLLSDFFRFLAATKNGMFNRDKIFWLHRMRGPLALMHFTVVLSKKRLFFCGWFKYSTTSKCTFESIIITMRRLLIQNINVYWIFNVL